MLTAILAVTLIVPDLETAQSAYVKWLDYQVIETGTLKEVQSQGWGAPLSEGRRYTLLQPASGATTYLRLIQSPATPGYEVMRTYGWNSNEILVKDPDALAEKLAAGSPFRIIGPPRPLSSSSTVRAMQAIGPAGELNYFTRIPEGGATFVKTSAQSFVDRTFIVVLGGPSMVAMQSFYRETLGVPVTESSLAKIKVLQEALELGDQAETALALVRIADGFLIELDEYPAITTARPIRGGDLPPGMSIVTFLAKDIDSKQLPWVVPPHARNEAPYYGRRAGMLKGAAGEWIELVEAEAPIVESTAK